MYCSMNNSTIHFWTMLSYTRINVIWQSCVEIKEYPIMYFGSITAFKVPYRWTFTVHLTDIWISHTSTKCAWALPLAKVQQYSTLYVASWLKYATLVSTWDWICLVTHGCVCDFTCWFIGIPYSRGNNGPVIVFESCAFLQYELRG